MNYFENDKKLWLFVNNRNHQVDMKVIYDCNEDEIEKRMCSYANVCVDWEEQSDEYYTYNDFYYQK